MSNSCEALLVYLAGWVALLGVATTAQVIRVHIKIGVWLIVDSGSDFVTTREHEHVQHVT